MDESTFDQELKQLAALADDIEAVAAKLKDMNERYDKLEWKLATYMDQTGTDSKKLDGVNFIKSQRTFAKIDDKAQLMDWVRANNAYELIMAVNSSKVTGFCNECITNGTELPLGVTPGFIKHGISIRRGK